MKQQLVGMPDALFAGSAIGSILVLILVLELRRTWLTGNTLRRQIMSSIGIISVTWSIMTVGWWLIAEYRVFFYADVYGGDIDVYVPRTYTGTSLLVALTCGVIAWQVLKWYADTAEDFVQSEEVTTTVS